MLVVPLWPIGAAGRERGREEEVHAPLDRDDPAGDIELWQSGEAQSHHVADESGGVPLLETDHLRLQDGRPARAKAAPVDGEGEGIHLGVVLLHLRFLAEQQQPEPLQVQQLPHRRRGRARMSWSRTDKKVGEVQRKQQAGLLLMPDVGAGGEMLTHLGLQLLPLPLQPQPHWRQCA
eukprot:CAMPEP_0185333386 /NCGR_PEP_ID=MMETSP1363-20130426/83276_1 /TAXON_ID=38817 /ORGANISM="Gephyrocapsa oceanica, Strain RCC1303" /LENGTH=176 /DNA_ID=CAMNT_0027932319 /DNA_START=1 /DNA_END=527 /DNA_ORIENTATION=-